MGEWSVREDSVAGRRQLESVMEERKDLEASKESGDWRKLRRGWCWGPKEFREELLEWVGAKKGQQHHGQESGESEEQKADRLITAMMRAAGWTEAELYYSQTQQSDKTKPSMAARLLREMAMTWTGRPPAVEDGALANGRQRDSKRFAKFQGASPTRQRLDCGIFSTALKRDHGHCDSPFFAPCTFCRE